MTPTKHRHRLRLRSIFEWHRYIGLAAAVFVIFLSITGIALNHDEDLHLEDRYVSSPWLLDWYGIGAPKEGLSVALGANRITLVGERLYINRRSLRGEYEDLIGGVRVEGMSAVGVSGELILFNDDGEIIERLDGADGVPSGMQAIGRDENGAIVVQAAHGLYHPDANLLKWTHWEGDVAQVAWNPPAPPPAALWAELQADYRAQVLTWERFMLDLHSGRLFGGWGRVLTDAIGIALILLGLSGLLLWVQRRRKRKQHQQRHHHPHETH